MTGGSFQAFTSVVPGVPFGELMRKRESPTVYKDQLAKPAIDGAILAREALDVNPVPNGTKLMGFNGSLKCTRIYEVNKLINDS